MKKLKEIYFEFYGSEDDDCGCYQYFVKAIDIKSAIDKFIAWEFKELKKNERWPEKIVKNEDNWGETDTIIIE